MHNDMQVDDERQEITQEVLDHLITSALQGDEESAPRRSISLWAARFWASESRSRTIHAVAVRTATPSHYPDEEHEDRVAMDEEIANAVSTFCALHHNEGSLRNNPRNNASCGNYSNRI